MHEALGLMPSTRGKTIQSVHITCDATIVQIYILVSVVTIHPPHFIDGKVEATSSQNKGTTGFRAESGHLPCF
jgi:hypothetical protein